MEYVLSSKMLQELKQLLLPTEAPLLSTTFFTILFGLLVYFYSPSWSVRKVPGPPPLPLVGNIPLLAKYGPDVFTNLAKRYGPIFRFHMGRQPLVIIADAELVREVGIKKFKYLPNRSIPSPLAASPLHTKGLFMTKDPRWSAMKNTVVSVYQPSHLAKLIPMMQEFIGAATKNLDSPSQVTFSDLSLKMTTDAIGKAAFGVDFGLSKPRSSVDEEAQQFIDQHIYSTTQLKMDLSGSISIILGLLVPFLQEPFRQILKRIPGTMDWKFERADKILCTRLNAIVEKRMRETTEISRSSSKDFLSLVLRARETESDTKKVFTDDYVTAVTYEHLLAGSTTTSFTLSCILYLVSGHREVEKKLLQEIDAFGPRERIPNADDLQNSFPYLDQVIKESMRFYTVSPLVAREALADIEIGGCVLPKGTWVWLAIGVLAKDPKNFPEPDKFKPERFDPNCEEEKRRHPYAHIPFGIGPRACIGQKFSLQELKVSVIHLYRNYTFRHSPEMENPLEFQYGIVVNFKHGVKLQAFKRNTT